ncbi:Sentrin-specific protease 6 [Zancudomyces culisetae]|uniref:Sentrin-specific protease 6 n=1 Tax=Zancudomyces culisetae TaxID=1213189 RepID=A0A1R1PS29_ZANCU|nr:Sentrin-specific protease 6 [Zancudomyces culisetae]|eukprot:OMH83785.1 Sentrin-specific protease 6 [Zancudomyces culisetae]
MSDVNKGCSTNDTLERDKEDRDEQEEEEGNNNGSSGSSGDGDGDGDGDGGEDNGDEVDVNDINTASDTNKSGDTSNDINNSETTEGEQDEKKHKVYTIKELEQMTREGIESDKGAETDNGIGENEAGGKQNESEAKNSGKKEEKPAIYRNVNEKTWILVLDSLGGKHHGAVVKTLKKYLECMVLQSTIEPTDTTDTTNTTETTDTTNTGDTQSELHLKYTQHVKNSAKTVYAKVPLQPNMCDCGMFLLEYIERFLKNPEFFTLYMANRGNALSTWFPTSAIREKRSSMIKLFVKLTKEYIDGKKINLQK